MLHKQTCFLLVNLHIDMGLEAVLPGPQNALYVMLYVMLCLRLQQEIVRENYLSICRVTLQRREFNVDRLKRNFSVGGQRAPCR